MADERGDSMGRYKKVTVFVLTLGLILLAACDAKSQQPPPPPRGEGTSAAQPAAAPSGTMSPMPSDEGAEASVQRPKESALPLWELKDVNGKTVKLSDQIGKKGVLMVFFATWCPYCMEEVPQLIEFSKKHEKQPVEVIAIAVNQPEQALQQFVKARGVNYTIVLDSDAAVAKQYNVPGIPLNIGIDGTGAVIFREHALPQDMDEFAKQLMTGLPGGAPVPASR
jgi:peroxiredoxin